MSDEHATPGDGDRPRTLVISDLHIGSRRRMPVLRRPQALEALLLTLEDCDRLVLLGDTLELFQADTGNSLREAESILGQIGRRVGCRRGRRGEVVVVPGNHDHLLIGEWLRAPGRVLTLETDVPSDCSPTLSSLTRALAPAHVSVRYPGVWLPGAVWATHGHYLDLHMLPIGALGIRRGRWATPAAPEVATATAYEAAWTERVPRARGRVGHGRPSIGRVVDRTLRPELAPLTWRLLDLQMRSFCIPAFGTVLDRLEVDADWVLFGHVHRLGPIAGDDPGPWAAPSGRPRILDTGSWVYEPRLLHGARPPHPYWPGGAVIVEGGRAPEAVNLLAGLSARELERDPRGV